MRDGTMPAAWENHRAVIETLERLPQTVRRVHLRTDGASWQENLIPLVNHPATRPGTLARFGTIGLCSAIRSDKLLEEVSRLDNDAW